MQPVCSALAEHELLARLSSGGHRDLLLTVEGGEHELGAEGSLNDGDGQRGDQVVAIAREHFVRSHADVNVEVAGSPTARPNCATPGQSQGGTRVDACRHIDLERLLRDDPSVALAAGARSDDHLTETAAAWAGAGRDHLAEQALTHALHLTAPVAFRAGDRLSA